MKDTSSKLNSESFYHIYNRANGNDKLFVSDENYTFFLKKYLQYIEPVVNTYSYCLMPNHFHFLVQIKTEKQIKEAFPLAFGAFPKFESLEKLISKQFSNFFSSYTQAFNKQQNRQGSLFIKNFKRIKVNEEKYFYKLVHYIHFNPVEAGLCNKPHEWKFSSYQSIISNSKTHLKRNEVIDWFNDLENFKFIHQYPPKETGIEN